MNTVPTVSDTKRAFYAHYPRPINSIYRRVIEELMVEMHLLSVNVNFAYDSLYALGVVTAFDRFTEGYKPDGERGPIFSALCQALNSTQEKFRQDAQILLNAASAFEVNDLIEILSLAPTAENSPELQETLKAIAARENFKYSRLFAIGLYTLLEKNGESLVADSEQLTKTLNTLSEALGLPAEKFTKDLELYRSNLDKLQQAREAMEDIVQAERKKREQRALEKQKKQEAAEQEGTATEEAAQSGEAETVDENAS